MAVKTKPKTVRGVYRPVVQRNTNPTLKQKTRGSIDVRVVIIHDTEGNDAPGIADIDGLISFFGRTAFTGVNWMVDADGNKAAYLETPSGGHVAPVKFNHAPPAHNWGVGIEMIGKASFTRAKWWTRPKQLMAVARILAYHAEHDGVPLVHDPTCQHGICTHADVSRAFRQSDHTDPGAGFPLGFVIKLARTYHRFGWKSGGILVAKR